MLSEAAVKRHALETGEQKNATSLKRKAAGGKDLILREWLYNDYWCGVPGCEWRACGDAGTAGRNRHLQYFHTPEERVKINDKDNHLIKLSFSRHFSKPQDANKYPEAANKNTPLQVLQIDSMGGHRNHPNSAITRSCFRSAINNWRRAYGRIERSRTNRLQSENAN